MKIAFITLTNKGYLPYTFNCLASIKKVGLPDLTCYAIGQDAYAKLVRQNHSTLLIPDERNTNYQSYRKGNWADIILYKFKIIHENLQQYDFVCFTDGDIVFKSAATLSYCKERIGTADLLIQNDTLTDASRENLCSGFLFIRSNTKTLKYFDPDYVKRHSDIVEGWGDQLYINAIKPHLDISVLPLSLFPNGRYFYHNHHQLTPYLIHFNWVIGHKKASRMVEFSACHSSGLLMLYLKEGIYRRWIGALKSRLLRMGLLGGRQ